MTSGIAGKAKEYGQTVVDAASQAREYITDKAGVVSDKLHDLRDVDYQQYAAQAKDYARQNPGQAFLVAAAAGFVIALLIRSRREAEESYARGRVHRAREVDLTYQPAAVSPLAETMPAREYVISKPTGFSLSSRRFSEQLRSLNSVPGLRVVDSIGDDEAKLVLLTETELTGLKARVPGLVIEPNIFYEHCVHPWLHDFNDLNFPASGSSRPVTVCVVEKGSARPLRNVPVYLVLDLPSKSGLSGVTDARGACRFSVPRSASSIEALVVDPEAGHWNKRLLKVPVQGNITVALDPLPCSSAAVYDWGHLFAGMSDDVPHKGDGITIGIIDSGISRDHPSLRPSGGRNCVSGEDESLWYEDASGHGTHCAGVVAATIAAGRGVKGYAPEAKIMAYKAVPKNAPGLSTFAISRAIDQALADGCDIINMSFRSPVVQTSISTRVEAANEKGVLCVAAVGNDAGGIGYPAGFQSVMGVGAFGKWGTYPADSLHAEGESGRHSSDGKYFLASFSNFGENLDFCAPGVAVVSTVPGGDYGVRDGTSMACPQVAGIAALALSAHPEVLNATRDATRADDLVHILKSRSELLGFGPLYEGAGGLKVTSLIKV
jgi:subtilisin